jgi:hypothetical protein
MYAPWVFEASEYRSYIQLCSELAGRLGWQPQVGDVYGYPFFWGESGIHIYTVGSGVRGEVLVKSKEAFWIPLLHQWLEKLDACKRVVTTFEWTASMGETGWRCTSIGPGTRSFIETYGPTREEAAGRAWKAIMGG